MIDYINYYFDLYPININTNGDKYSFYINTEKYYFIPYDRSIEELDELIELNKQMISSGSLVHEIILNKFDNALNNYDGKSYILLRTYVNDSKKVNIEDLIFMLNEGKIVESNKKISRTSWSNLWESKIDYFEYQMVHVLKKYPLLYYTSDYYIGLGENAILYLKDIVPKYQGSIELGVCHRRIGVNSTLFDLYNPLNLIIDFKVRDLGEYIKDAFFNDCDIKNISNKIFDSYYFDKLNLSLLVSRLLFPSYFFDRFEKIINDNINENNVMKIIKKSSDFEDFMSEFIKVCNLQNISWIN